MITTDPVRFSNLKQMARSPAHYANTIAVPMVQSKAMLFGDALDAIIFGTKQVLTFDGASRRTKMWTAFAEENPTAIKLLPKERITVDGMVATLSAHKDAMELLRGVNQQTVLWSMNGRACRGTPDSYTLDRVVDLKSTRNSKPEAFAWDGRKMAYHAQVTFYRNGLAANMLCAPDADCYLVAVENTPPFPVTVLKLTERAMLEGNKLWRLWFEQLLVCEASDSWPTYTQSVAEFDTPDTDALTLSIEGEDVEIE